jgi:L-asparaginase II
MEYQKQHAQKAAISVSCLTWHYQIMCFCGFAQLPSQNWNWDCSTFSRKPIKQKIKELTGHVMSIDMSKQNTCRVGSIRTLYCSISLALMSCLYVRALQSLIRPWSSTLIFPTLCGSMTSKFLIYPAKRQQNS